MSALTVNCCRMCPAAILALLINTAMLVAWFGPSLKVREIDCTLKLNAFCHLLLAVIRGNIVW
jgi:hypothetical protein